MPVESGSSYPQVTCPARASLSSSWQQGCLRELKKIVQLYLFHHLNISWEVDSARLLKQNKTKTNQNQNTPTKRNHQTTVGSLGPSHDRAAVWGQRDGCPWTLPVVLQLCWRPHWQVCWLRWAWSWYFLVPTWPKACTGVLQRPAKS